MCLIVDANAAHTFLAAEGEVRTWLFGPRGNPRLVVGGLLTVELQKLEVVRKLLVQLDRAGRLRKMAPNAVDAESKALAKRAICHSNDLQVLALAIISGARTIATYDEALIQDCKNPEILSSPRSKIYRHPALHQRLLGHASSCGVKAK